jgi:hypothetical protein
MVFTALEDPSLFTSSRRLGHTSTYEIIRIYRLDICVTYRTTPFPYTTTIHLLQHYIEDRTPLPTRLSLPLLSKYKVLDAQISMTRRVFFLYNDLPCLAHFFSSVANLNAYERLISSRSCDSVRRRSSPVQCSWLSGVLRPFPQGVPFFTIYHKPP